MQAGLDGDLQLRAHAVGGRDQQRVIIARRLQVKQRPKAAEGGFGACPPGRLRERLDGVHKRIAGVDIDTRLGVGQPVWPFGHFKALAPGGVNKVRRPCIGRLQTRSRARL